MPPTGLRPIGHEEKLTLVDHLTELRKRLLISAFTLVAAFSFCFWQNNAILDIVTKPVRETQNLNDPSKSSKDPLEQAARFQIETGQAFEVLAPALGATARTFKALEGAENLTAAQRASVTSSAAELARASRAFAQAAAARPTSTQRNLVTLGVTEPFTATITIAFYASLLLALPMLLFQAYAFVLPAFSPGERKVALPLMLMVPVLFIMGAAFGYFVVLTRAVAFLQNFNDDSFDILLQAKDYFKFAVLFVAGVGFLFQIPVGVLAVTRLGIFTPKQLAKNRGYVILGIAVLAAIATPTPDPFTMSLAMAPLIVLFELSILLARWLERIKPPGGLSSRWDDDDEDDDDEPDDPDDLGPDEDPEGRFDDDDPDDLNPDDLDADEDPARRFNSGHPDDAFDEDDREEDLVDADPPGVRGDLTKLGEPDRKD